MTAFPFTLNGTHMGYIILIPYRSHMGSIVGMLAWYLTRSP